MIDDAIQQQIWNRLGCEPSEARLLGGYNNNVFEINRGNSIVVKILERAVTSESLMLSEMEWLVHLSGQGMPVIKPLRLDDGKYIQPVSEASANTLISISYRKGSGPSLIK